MENEEINDAVDQETAPQVKTLNPSETQFSEEKPVSDVPKKKSTHKKCRLFSILKENRVLFFTYFILLLCAGLGVYYITEERIDDSLRELKSQVYFSSNCISFGNGRTITAYEKEDIPTLSDASKQEQMYGSVKTFYKADQSNCWSIRYLKKVSETKWEYYLIKPWAVGLFANCSTSVGDVFSELYDGVVSDDDLNCNKANEYTLDVFSSHKTKYHYIAKSYSSYGSESGSTWWRNYYNRRAYYDYTCLGSYEIEEDSEAVTHTYLILGVIAFLLVSLLMLLISFISRSVRGKQKSEPKPKMVLDSSSPIPPHDEAPIAPAVAPQDHEFAASTELNDRFERIKLAINPVQFMAPYDAEKVRIANDLYEALLKNKDNETILEMIEEKAKKSLGVIL